VTTRALALLDHDGATGWIGERARRHGISLVQARRSAADSPPPLAGFDLILSFGSVWSVTEADRISWIRRELELLRQATNLGVPVLGICFGGQLLARALGGGVQRAASPEIGWVSVGSIDHRIVRDGPWFTWHNDVFDVPAGARLLAANAISPQAYQAGRSLGLQFHPEVTRQMIRRWSANGREQLNAFGMNPAEVLERSDDHLRDARKAAHGLFDTFMELASS
jgi:GMP synthase-like glutamine amidotransferase